MQFLMGRLALQHLNCVFQTGILGFEDRVACEGGEALSCRGNFEGSGEPGEVKGEKTLSTLEHRRSHNKAEGSSTGGQCNCEMLDSCHTFKHQWDSQTTSGTERNVRIAAIRAAQGTSTA